MKSYFLIISLFALSLFVSCSGSKKEERDTAEIQYSEEVAEVISYITAGTVLPNDEIVVEFVDDVVASEDLNKTVANPFDFSPGISGEAKWTGVSTLVFTPSKPMASRKNYTGKLDLKKVSPDLDDLDVDLKFYVSGRDLLSFKGELELENPGKPLVLVYRGKVSFSQETSVETVQKACSFASFALNWNQESNTSFSFVSEGIKRQSDIKQYAFKINKNILDLAESFERSVEVVPLKKMKLSGLEKDEQGKSPKVMLKFSDRLDENQDLGGFISVEPEIKFNAQKMGKYLALNGEFKFGSSYTITVAQGVQSKWGTKTDQVYSKQIQFSDIQPQVQFASKGVFMPTSNDKRLQFLTANLKRVHVEVKKVFDSNLERFFRNETVKSTKQRSTEFNNSYVSSVGAIVYNQTLEIGENKNQWLIHNLALDNVLQNYQNGLYLIRINFNPQDVLVPLQEDELVYAQKHGQIYKPVTISDIGIIAKHQGDDRFEVFTTDLKTGKPMQGVRVEVIDYYSGSNSATTNSEGKARLSGSRYDMIKASKGDQVSMIEPDEMRWNNSGFDVGGLSDHELKTRAFIYTERGVYRPGDSINLSCIVRYKSGKSSITPAYFKLYNPEGTLVHEATQKYVVDGFYNFNFGTDMNAPTGNWSAQVNVGNKYFYHTLKIETVVANKLKVKVTPEMRTVLPEHKQLGVEIESRYLFGATADGLPYESEVEIFAQRNAFPKYKNYTFFNQYVEFQDITGKISQGRLDDQGKARVIWNVPNLRQSPSPLKARISATVQEEGGRPNDAWAFVDVHPFNHYVGIDRSADYVKLNDKVEIPVVLVNHDGNAAPGREMVYRIYRNDSYWWYQYNSYRDFKLRYKSDKHSFLVEEGSIISGNPVSYVPFQPSQRGQYLIEVQEAVSQGHVSSIFVSAYPYGGIPSGDENAGTLALRTEKSKYEVGEEAVISFPNPKQGNILLTVERGNQVLSSRWITPDTENDDMKVKLPITKNMSPNIYATVTVLQEHSQTLNDRPLRMFGILPITVVDPATKQELIINMPDELKPKQTFTIDINTVSKKPTQLTVAVVDEGLLDLTNFKTPDPWKAFFRKIRLGVVTFDMFGHVIGANESDVFKTFSIGGDMDYRESQVDPFKKKKRFKPVCMFKGPLQTDSQGRASVEFTMPNYVGSVRVMVVSAKEDSYGSAEKTVPVKSALIVQPTLPRALKPGDEFEVPVNVFATKENIGQINLNISTEGPLEVLGQKSYTHTFSKEDDQLFHFRIKVKEAVGQARVVIKGTGKGVNSQFEADIPVSPSAARIYEKTEKLIKPGETISLDLPKLGLDGTNNARLQLSMFPNMDFLHRLEFLIRYPYGCIEQTTSSVFPQLALKSLLGDENHNAEEIDKNIDAGISRLRKFQLSNGGFSYWPGGTKASSWGSNYAGQFLIEARKKGYVVSDLMYNGIVKYLERESRNGPKDKKHLMTRVNRCYVLALANKAPINEMNLLKQNHFSQMNNVQKWQLVTAYKLAGAYDKVANLVEEITTDVEEYSEFAHTYGSRNRDLGIILRCLVLLDKQEDAALMAKYVAEKLSERTWYSTQTLGQMLLGIGNYFDYAGISSTKDLIIEGEVILADGSKKEIKTVDKYALYINEGYGKSIKVKLNSDVKAEQLFATLSSNGVPLVDKTGEENKNIGMAVYWYDEDGKVIDISRVKQGETFYGRFMISNKSVIPVIEEVALVQLIPSGWEIENTRLNSEVMPGWMSGWNTNEEEYLDIRDDRIMWFFDLRKGEPFDFVVKINAITKGSYTFPGARCEAMYNADYVATKASQQVSVVD